VDSGLRSGRCGGGNTELGGVQRAGQVGHAYDADPVDVWASVAGGVRVGEAAADLAAAIAVASSRLEASVPAETVAVGEVGLGGEIRQVPQAPRRLAEALRLGFRSAIVPVSTPDVRGMTLRRVGDLREALVAASFGPG